MLRKNHEETGKNPKLIIVEKSSGRPDRNKQCNNINFKVNLLFKNDF